MDNTFDTLDACNRQYTLIIELGGGHSEEHTFETKEQAVAKMQQCRYNYGHGDSVFTPIRPEPTFKLYVRDEFGLVPIKIDVED